MSSGRSSLLGLSVAGMLLVRTSAPAQAPAPTGPPAALETGRPSVGDSRDAPTAPWRVGAFVGAAHNSPVSSSLGVTPGRDHLLVGIDALTPVLRAGPLRLHYALQVLPLVLIRGRAAPAGYPSQANGEVPGAAHAYAVGLSPFGFELDTPPARRLAIYGAAAAGGLIFTRPFPVPEARRINFTLEYGGGVLVRAGRARWVRAGYKYHHLSNAYTAAWNPGLDGNVFYAGYERAVRLPR